MKIYTINGDKKDIKCEQVDGLTTSERAYVISGEDIRCSDGYHTMNELYEHRITLFIALCRVTYWHSSHLVDGVVWRSKKHDDDTMFPGWFILGICLEKGHQITYHLPIEKWLDTDFAKTLDKAPMWDGHTSNDVLERLKDL